MQQSLEQQSLEQQTLEQQSLEQQSLEQQSLEQQPLEMLAGNTGLLIITGHYGVGKTNLILNLALGLLAVGRSPTLVDLDIVNPYFRSSDSADQLAAAGVRLLGPIYAGSTLDSPCLPPGIDVAIQAASSDQPLLVDVGGDPDGARALAQYAGAIRSRPYNLIYLANFNRPDVASPNQALLNLRAIEARCGLSATAIIGNNHLKEFSSTAQILDSLAPLAELSRLAGLPILAITAPAALAPAVAASAEDLPVLPLQILVTTPWEDSLIPDLPHPR